MMPFRATATMSQRRIPRTSFGDEVVVVDCIRGLFGTEILARAGEEFNDNGRQHANPGEVGQFQVQSSSSESGSEFKL
jgi:hypothetical protein